MGDNTSYNVLEADGGVALVDWTPNQTYTDLPACDYYEIPTPTDGLLDTPASGAAVKDNSGYDCVVAGDCHLYVVDHGRGFLYEQYKSDEMDAATTPERSGGCTRRYDITERFDNFPELGCRAANTVGVPHTAFIPGPDFKGTHMLSFTLPDQYVERDVVHRPATHNPVTTAGSDPAEAGPGTPFPYGGIVVLRSDWVPTNGSIGAAEQNLVDAMKTYGMQHVGGGTPGEIILSNDLLADTDWNAANGGVLAADNLSLRGLRWDDFRVIAPFGTAEEETVFEYTNPVCSRTQEGDFIP